MKGVLPNVFFTLDKMLDWLFPVQKMVKEIFLVTLKNNSFYQTINEELKKATDLKGDILYTRDPALDVDKQCQQIEEFNEKKVSVIVINPVDGENKKIQQALRRAHKKKIKIIAVDSQLSDSSYIDSSIVSDNFRAGKLSAQYLMKHDRAANILVLRHWNALSVKERYAGFLATLDSTKYQVTQNVETLGQTDIALKQTLKTVLHNIFLQPPIRGF